MSEENGCVNFFAVAGFAIGVFLLVNNVDPVVVEYQVPPPQESWSYVYPRFRDDVSAQLQNTQELVGIAIRNAEYIEAQNADLQQSINIILDDLGLLQKKQAEESRRQRVEQWLLMGIGAVVGWVISVLLPAERVEKFAAKIFQRRVEELPSSDQPEGIQVTNTIQKSISLRELNRVDPVAKLLSRIIIFAVASLVVLIIAYFILTR